MSNQLQQVLLHQKLGNLASLPGYQVNEYQLVMAIPDAVKEKIRRVRTVFSAQFAVGTGSGAAVMLPLLKFRQRMVLEERVRISLQQIVSGWKPVQVNLQDYGSLPTHSIFIPVSSRQVWQPMIRDLKTISSLLRPDKEQQPFFVAEPVINLGTRLPPGVFEKAWKQYSHKQFTAQFRAEACLLLKRKNGETHWQILQRFEWRNLPIGVQQASLFA